MSDSCGEVSGRGSERRTDSHTFSPPWKPVVCTQVQVNFRNGTRPAFISPTSCHIVEKDKYC